MLYTDLDDFIRDLPLHAAHVADKLRGHDLLALIETKQGRRVYIQLKDGQALVLDETDAKPDCTAVADENDLLAVVRGELNPAKALLTRRIAVKGNVKALMSLISLIA